MPVPISLSGAQPGTKRTVRIRLSLSSARPDNVTIKRRRLRTRRQLRPLSGARFFVTHNSRETKYWRVMHEKMPKTLEEIENIPHADASDKEIEELILKLKVFKEDEFADLLHQCHNVIRNREKLDPAAAFDEIAKILFVKVYVERELRAKRQRRTCLPSSFSTNRLGKTPAQDALCKDQGSTTRTTRSSSTTRKSV